MGIDGIKKKITMNEESCNNKRKKIDSDLKTFEQEEEDSVFEESDSESYESEFDDGFDENGMKGQRALHSKEPSELTVVRAGTRKREGITLIEKEDYPGYYYAVTSLYPVTCCPNLDLDNYNQYMEVATLAIIKYNRTHGTEFRVLKVVRLNCVRGMYVTYYMTFSAVTATSDVPIVFQATVTENLIDKKEKRKIYSCKIKPNTIDAAF